MRFQNPANGFEVETNHPGLWTLLFGLFYFLKHEAWAAAVISGLAAFLTFGLAWFICPFFGKTIIRNSYLKRGWRQLE